MMTSTRTDTPQSWLDARRIEAWAGELRVNVFRLIAILVFYARHLIEYLMAAPGDPVRGTYHLRITAVCVLWSAAAIVLHAMLTKRRVHALLPYGVVAL